MRIRSPLLVAFCAVLIVGLLATAAWLWRQRKSLMEERAANTRELIELRGRIHRLETAPASGARVAPESAGETYVRRLSRQGAASLAERDAEIEQLKRNLGAQTANITQLQAQVSALEEESKRLQAGATERALKDQEACRARLDELKQQAGDAHSDVVAARVRIADLEATAARLKASQGEDAARAIETARMLASLRELNRRRDTYVRSIVRRYQDAAAQLRALNALLDSTRDQNASVAANSALTRIQNTISTTEDDLRQLSDLTAQVEQLERKLEKR